VTENAVNPSVTTPYLDALLRDRKVIVCCGAGGVGKTTTAAALGLAAARLGRRTLVLTIDPARRLGEALGLGAPGPKPSRVTRSGSVLDAWMLDPRVVFEGMVRRLSTDEAQVARILRNRLYGALSNLVAGMQEYTAAEALHAFVESGDYDLVVLDTPPSRNALEFIEAPRKLSAFLSERIVSIFLPGGGGLFARGARNLVTSVFGRVFGEGFFQDLQEFLSAFSGMFSAMRAHSETVRALLMSGQAAFVVVTSPDPSALEEGLFLQTQLAALGLPFAGYVLNKSWAYTRAFSDPAALQIPADAPPGLRTGLDKLATLAQQERSLAVRDREVLAKLAAQGGNAVPTPHLGTAIDDFSGLIALADSFVSRPRSSDPSSREP
jgi:anion-transporting  ArsA/GET3 family ATPase